METLALFACYTNNEAEALGNYLKSNRSRVVSNGALVLVWMKTRSSIPATALVEAGAATQFSGVVPLITAVATPEGTDLRINADLLYVRSFIRALYDIDSASRIKAAIAKIIADSPKKRTMPAR